MSFKPPVAATRSKAVPKKPKMTIKPPATDRSPEVGIVSLQQAAGNRAVEQRVMAPLLAGKPETGWHSSAPTQAAQRPATPARSERHSTDAGNTPPVSAEEGLTAVASARAGITETVTHGVAIEAPVGSVTRAEITAGRANRPSDVRIVQRRLVELSYLARSHREEPPEDATDGIPSERLHQTTAALKRFQEREVKSWLKRKQISGTLEPSRIVPGDATWQLLNDIKSYREQFASGEDITFRDHPSSPYTINPRGTSVGGTSDPSALPVDAFTEAGLTAPEARALQYVSSHEGKFDALNTYDKARVSFGFIQFAGGRGLPPMMASLKATQPEAFRRMFQTYGIDVEHTRSGPVLTVLDPASGTVLRGEKAESAIRDSQKLSAVFIRAGRDPGVQHGQIEAAAQGYVRPTLGAQVEFSADVIDVLSSTGAIEATHAGAAARAFRQTNAYQTLRSERRIQERRARSSSEMRALLPSEQGMAVVMDRAIQEGAGEKGGGTTRVRGAMQWVADREGLTDIAQVAGREQRVLQQVVDDYSTDIEIASRLDQTLRAIDGLKTATREKHATVEGVLANADAERARRAIQEAEDLIPQKSFVANRSQFAAALQQADAKLGSTPGSLVALRNDLAAIRRALVRVKPNAADMAARRKRVQDILNSRLAAPQ